MKSDLQLTDRLRELLPGLLEQQAFVFCDPADPDEAADEAADDDAILANVTFSGDAAAGWCQVGASRTLCMEIAANLLGIEPDDDSAGEIAGDSLKEIANVATGHVLTELFGETTEFRIDAPTVVWSPAGEWHLSLAGPDTCVYLADESPVWLSIHLQAEDSSVPPLA